MIVSELNKRITVRVLTDGYNADTSPNDTPSDYMSTLAKVYVRSGMVKIGDNEEFIYSTEFTLRYNSLSKMIDNKYEIVYNDKRYKIIEVIEVDPPMTTAIKFITSRYE